jgi:hypothetical protein
MMVRQWADDMVKLELNSIMKDGLNDGFLAWNIVSLSFNDPKNNWCGTFRTCTLKKNSTTVPTVVLEIQEVRFGESHVVKFSRAKF